MGGKRPWRIWGTIVAIHLLVLANRDTVANEIGILETIRNTDFVSAGIGGIRDFGDGDIILSGVSGSVTKAYLYWHGPTNSEDPGAGASIMMNGTPLTDVVNIGFSDDNCWGYVNSQAYRADVTSLVAGNATYRLTGFGADCVTVSEGVNTNGASLIVFFDDGFAFNNRDVVIFNGNDSNVGSRFDSLGWDVLLTDISYVAGSARIQLHVSDGQTLVDAAVIVNGIEVESQGGIFDGEVTAAHLRPSPECGGGPDDGSLWDIENFDATPFLVPGKNSLNLTTGFFNDCISLIVALVDLPAGNAPDGPSIQCSGPVVESCTGLAGNEVTLSVNVTDPSGDPLTIRWQVGSEIVQEDNIAGGGDQPTEGTAALTRTFFSGLSTIDVLVDDGHNVARCAASVTILDTLPPTITRCPGGLGILVSDVNTEIEFSFEASDSCDPALVLQSDPPSGTIFDPGDTEVFCTATDGANNMDVCTFNVRVLPCIDFELSRFGVVHDQTLIRNEYLQLGVRVSGRSNSGRDGAVARTPGPPGSATSDILPASPPNYLQTLSGTASSDSGSITFRFVDPLTRLPRPVCFVQLSFLDIEDSGFGAGGRGVSKLQAFDILDNLLSTVEVPMGGNGAIFVATIGAIEGNLEIGRVVATVGDSDDSGGVDRLCFFPKPDRLDLRILGSRPRVAIGKDFDFTVFGRNNTEEPIPVRLQIRARLTASGRGRSVVLAEVLTMEPTRGLRNAHRYRIHIPGNLPLSQERTLRVAATFRHQVTGELLAKDEMTIRLTLPER